MHPRRTVDRALRLSSRGLLDREVAQLVGVPAGTIWHWRRGDSRNESDPKRKGAEGCPRCGPPVLDFRASSYLLGLYLGDGHITFGTKGIAVLWIYCADAWPGLLDEARTTVSAVMPTSAVYVAARDGCTAVKSCAKHWPCLFPQHGSGMKHERKIELEGWQEEIVAEHTQEFLRGLIHSDGCRCADLITRRFGVPGQAVPIPAVLFQQ